jgi:hypothetical protein
MFGIDAALMRVIEVSFAGAGWVLVQPGEGRILDVGGSSGGGGLLANLGG